MPAVEPRDKTHIMHDLRARIVRLESRGANWPDNRAQQGWTTGHTELDSALGGALAIGAVHEVVAAAPPLLPSACAFALGLLARLKRQGPVFWCMSGLARNEHGGPYGPGLAALGIDPARIIAARVRHPRDVSFVLEEAARLPTLAAILAEGPQPSFTASRRLCLLLAQSGVPALLLPDGGTMQGSAAATRFVIAPLGTIPMGIDPRAPGPPAFHVTLARHRGGRSGLQFETVFNHETLSFDRLAGYVFPEHGFAAPHARHPADSLSGGPLPVADTPSRQRSA